MTPYLQTAGWALIHFVWQGAAIAAVIAVALRLLERRSANARYIVACAGLVAMLAAPAVTGQLIWAAETGAGVAAAQNAAEKVSTSRLGKLLLSAPFSGANRTVGTISTPLTRCQALSRWAVMRSHPVAYNTR